MPDTEQMKEQINSLTIHGLSNITSAQTWFSRIIWLTLCLLSCAFLIYTAATSFVKYSSYEVTEKVELKQNQHLALPAVTFCQTDFFHPMLFHHMEPPVFQNFPKNCNFTSKQHFINDINKLFFSILCQMFIGTFDGKASAMDIINSKYFLFPDGFSFLPSFYPCATLNRNSTLIQETLGEIHGLNMILFVADVKHPFYDYEVDNPLGERRQGIYVKLHEPKQQLHVDEGILLPAGYHTHIAIKKNVIKRLPSPYSSKCEEDGPNRGSIFPGKNTESMCFLSCICRFLYTLCSGMLPELTVFMKESEFPSAANQSVHTLMSCIIKNFHSIDVKQCGCAPHCYEETYSITTSRNPWPLKWQRSTLSNMVNKLEGVQNRNLSLEQIRNRLTKVSIYYETFKETIYEETPLYDFVSISSNLGGQMGLFLGASIISIAEILWLLATFLHKRFAKRPNVEDT